MASFVDGEPLYKGDFPRHGLLVSRDARRGADTDDRIAREEVFGPVAALIPFADEAEAIRIANDSDYGLSGSIWTENGARAIRVARALDTGVLSINSNSRCARRPRSAASSSRGFGRELGMHATGRLLRGQERVLLEPS